MSEAGVVVIPLVFLVLFFLHLAWLISRDHKRRSLDSDSRTDTTDQAKTRTLEPPNKPHKLDSPPSTRRSAGRPATPGPTHLVRFGRADLVPMLPKQPGVCDVCYQGADGGRCRSCHFGVARLTAGAPVVAPISLRYVGGPLADCTANYKRAADRSVREEATSQLAWLVEHFLIRHERCIARAAEVSGFDFVVPVPSSTQGRGPHALVEVLKRVDSVQHRLRDALYPVGSDAVPHRLELGRFAVSWSDVAFSNILLVDDTWTSGSNAFAATETLVNAGAAAVSVLVIGRHFKPTYSDVTERYFDHVKSVPFSFDVCVHCDDRLTMQLPSATHPAF